MFYLDSSAWVKRNEREEGTEWIDGLWRNSLPLACCRLGLVEVVSAVVSFSESVGATGTLRITRLHRFAGFAGSRTKCDPSAPQGRQHLAGGVSRR